MNLNQHPAAVEFPRDWKIPAECGNALVLDWPNIANDQTSGGIALWKSEILRNETVESWAAVMSTARFKFSPSVFENVRASRLTSTPASSEQHQCLTKPCHHSWANLINVSGGPQTNSAGAILAHHGSQRLCPLGRMRFPGRRYKLRWR